jgi:N4-gp56 family major capsid protein
MATTEYGVNDQLAVKLWSRKLYEDVVGKGYYGRFLGRNSNSLFQIKEESSKGPGDKVTFGLRGLPVMPGIQGDATLEGNEEALLTYTDAVFVDQLRHAFRTGGRMSEQRVPFSVREELRFAATDWWYERMEVSIANQLVGYADQTDTRYTGNQVAIEPSTATGVTRIIVGGNQTAEASLSATTTHAIKLSDLDKAAAIAKTQTPRIRPIRVDGKELFVCFLHPYQILQLRQDAATQGNFFDVQKAQLQGGKISDNPIITGGEFIYNGVIVYEWPYLPVVKNTVASFASYRRGVFCGAQALAVGIWSEQFRNPNELGRGNVRLWQSTWRVGRHDFRREKGEIQFV